MLRTISPDFVKIDGGIVAAATTEPTARAVLLAIATYAHETGSYVIAESIEDEETLDFIGNLDNRNPQASKVVQGGQGYGLGRPVPICALQELVEGTQPDRVVADVSPTLRGPAVLRLA
jgi:EAL domain-containing protein (putative c-di-GMP-specific phosphodiesterase class I)